MELAILYVARIRNVSPGNVSVTIIPLFPAWEVALPTAGLVRMLVAPTSAAQTELVSAMMGHHCLTCSQALQIVDLVANPVVSTKNALVVNVCAMILPHFPLWLVVIPTAVHVQTHVARTKNALMVCVYAQMVHH